MLLVIKQLGPLNPNGLEVSTTCLSKNSRPSAGKELTLEGIPRLARDGI